MITACPSCTAPFEPRKGWLHLCHTCLAEREDRKVRAKAEKEEAKEHPVRCVRCGELYERLRSSGHFCEVCADAHKREVDNENQRNKYAIVREVVDRAKRTHPEIDPGVLEAVLRDKLQITYVLSDQLAEASWMGDILRERLEESGLADDFGRAAMAKDAPPTGASSPYGPEEGYSTYFEDLEGTLRQLRKESAQHSWWKENPHALYRLGEDDAGGYALAPGLKCGGRRGSHAGYNRHRYAKEAACPDCVTAEREYTAARRSAA